MIEKYSGFGEFTVGETYSNRNPFMTLAVIATQTKRLILGATVLTAVQHPVLLARDIITLEELATGRAELHIGLGGLGHFPKFGLTMKPPIATLREAISVVKQLIAGEKVTYKGKTIDVKNRQIAWASRRKIPVWAAVNGLKLSRTAGKIADGLYMAMRSAGYVALAVKEFVASATEADRKVNTLPIGQHIVTYIARDYKSARNKIDPDLPRIKTRMHRFAIETPLVLEATGFNANEIDSLREQPEQIPQEVLERFIREFYLVGSPDDIIQRLLEYERIGCTFTYLTLSRRSNTRVEDISLIGDYVLPEFTKS